MNKTTKIIILIILYIYCFYDFMIGMPFYAIENKLYVWIIFSIDEVFTLFMLLMSYLYLSKE